LMAILLIHFFAQYNLKHLPITAITKTLYKSQHKKI